MTHVMLTYASDIHTIHSLSTSFAAWSPDGRYLITDLSFRGSLDAPEVISRGSKLGKVTDMARDNPSVMSAEEGKSSGYTDLGSHWLEELGLVAQPEDESLFAYFTEMSGV